MLVVYIILVVVVRFLPYIMVCMVCWYVENRGSKKDKEESGEGLYKPGEDNK